MQQKTIFDWLLNSQLYDYKDVEGRPMGEGRSKIYSQINTTIKTCPYAGTRYHHAYPMNASALESILPEWQHTLVLLSWLGQRYRTFNQTDTSTFYDLARVSGCGVFLSDYLVLRRQNPLSSDEIPVLLSGLYKVCLGFQQATFLAMMHDKFIPQEQKKLPDAKSFYAWLEEHELLIGEDEVCGGSEAMINRAYECMRGMHDIPECVEDQLPQLKALQIDWDDYDRFVANTSNLWRKAILFVILMQDFGIQINQSCLPVSLQQQINTWLKESIQQLLSQQHGLAVNIAHIALEESGRSLSEWVEVQHEFMREIGYEAAAVVVKDSAHTRRIMLALADKFELSKEHYAMIEKQVCQQVARFTAFETAILRSFNEHLQELQKALGYADEDKNILQLNDLSAVYGGIMSDWLK
jgi:hypothetical protein